MSILIMYAYVCYICIPCLIRLLKNLFINVNETILPKELNAKCYNCENRAFIYIVYEFLYLKQQEMII